MSRSRPGGLPGRGFTRTCTRRRASRCTCSADPLGASLAGLTLHRVGQFVVDDVVGFLTAPRDRAQPTLVLVVVLLSLGDLTVVLVVGGVRDDFTVGVLHVRGILRGRRVRLRG